MAQRIMIEKRDLNLKMMLEGGQSFRWKETAAYEWTGVMSDLLWIIRQFDNYIEYEVHGNSLSPIIERKNIATKQPENVGLYRKNCINNYEYSRYDKMLKEYLRLHDEVHKYYEEWSSKDYYFKKVSSHYLGIRILNQEPVENIFSFICSANNNIKRIKSMVDKLCKLYGKKIVRLNGETFYGFPNVTALTKPTIEMELRNAGFGYRAKFIHKSAEKLLSLGGVEYLISLKNVGYELAKENLMKFPGIGAKVADCICLMSLGYLQAVPVDTHILKIATKFYLPHLRESKTFTNKIYDEIGFHFRTLYGPMAGWAQAVLFCADLRNLDEVKSKKESRKLTNYANVPVSMLDDIVHDGNKVIESGSLNCNRKELHLKITLNSGQTYRWKELETDVWRGVFNNRVWTLKQSDNKIDFTSVRCMKEDPPNKRGLLNSGTAEQLLYEYFRLGFPLEEYYIKWAKSDAHFKEISSNFYGLRMVKQDIVENIFAFICSSNNTINRMRTMVETMCKLYGEEITIVDGEMYYNFPSVDKLIMENVEKDLRATNFGFRASYVRDSAHYIIEHGGHSWIHNLSQLSYEDAKTELMQLPGVGAKIADCICLTALGHLNTIPVDTHVYQLAANYYLPHLKKTKAKKSQNISLKVYKEIGHCFRKTFGDYAGWAHTVLFCSELRQHLHLKSPKK